MVTASLGLCMSAEAAQHGRTSMATPVDSSSALPLYSCRADPAVAHLRPYDPLAGQVTAHTTLSASRYSQTALVSGVARHPRNVSTLTSEPQSTSTTARKTSPPLPFRRWTTTSFVVIDPSEVAFPLMLPFPLVSRTGLPGVAGFEETRFHAELPDELSSALKYETELLSASIHAVSSLKA